MFQTVKSLLGARKRHRSFFRIALIWALVATYNPPSIRFPGVTLEHHLEKTLTFLAFFDGSSKHKDFLEARDPVNLVFSEDQKNWGQKFQDRCWRTAKMFSVFFLTGYSTPSDFGVRYPQFLRFRARCRHHQHIRFGDIANDILA